MQFVERAGWLVAAFVLAALAIPWFQWGSATVVAGLPLWLWWHVGWMLLASVVFWLFTKRAWGIGIEPDAGNGAVSGSGDGGESDATAAGGERP